MYDARLKCDRAEDKDGPLCYKQTHWVDNWMNNDVHKAILGVHPGLNFTSCDNSITFDFLLHGDGMYPTYRLLPELVNSGIRLLVYAGKAGESSLIDKRYCDLVCVPLRYVVQLYGMILFGAVSIPANRE